MKIFYGIIFQDVNQYIEILKNYLIKFLLQMTQAIQSFHFVKLYGNQQNYQQLKSSQDIFTKLQKSPLYYSLYAQQQIAQDTHNFNIIKSLLLNKSIKPTMLKYLSLGVFSPIYPLITHYNYFKKFIEFAKDSLKSEIIQDINNLKVIGGVLEDEINVNLKMKNNFKIIKVNNGRYKIQQDSDSYFYSKSSSIYINAAVLIGQIQGEQKSIYIRLRNNQFNPLSNVRTKYFGEVISFQYRLLGFNLNNYQFSDHQILDNKLTIKNYFAIKADKQFYQFQLSLLELYKAVDITIKYTSMRKQFKTLPNSKQQRKIITYQAITSRIADALALSYSLASLYYELQKIQLLRIGFQPYFQYTHHVILQSIMTLRQCCGGFGYIKYSGLPQLIQRVAYRASLNKRNADMPQNQKMLNIQIQKEYDNSQTGLWFFDFNLLGLNRRTCFDKNNQQEVQKYIYEFIKHSALTILSKNLISNSHRKKFIHDQQLIKYLSIKYIFQNYKYQKIQKNLQTQQAYLNKLYESKSRVLVQINNLFGFFVRVYNLTGIPDVIYGQQNEEKFYDRLLETTKANRRNEIGFLRDVRRPMIEFLSENNSGKL